MGYKRSNPQISFSDLYIARHTRRHKFFNSINTLVDWQPIAKELDKIYTRGRNKGGQRAYRGILLFKMLLIGIWYNLSDEQTEDMILDSFSAMDFCALKLEDDVPDHSTLSRFRSELAAKKAFARMLKRLNAQLEDKGIMVHSGKAKVDATITQSPRTPKGRKTYEVAQDRFEQDRPQDQQERETHQMKLIEVEQSGVDAQGRWLKKIVRALLWLQAPYSGRCRWSDTRGTYHSGQ